MQNQSVIVLTPNGRRQTVKVDPNKTILHILETVCQKHKFDSENFTLKFHNKLLDTSLFFRFAGLPNNCNLEMVELDTKRATDSEIEICLQFEDGSRKAGNYLSSTFLQDILNDLCPEKSQLEQNPVIIYMRKEVYGEDLSKTNLKTLGLQSGKAMMRVLNKKPEELKVQANVSAPLPQKPKEDIEEPVKNRTKASSGTIITPDLIKSLRSENVEQATVDVENKEAMEVEEKEEEPEPKVIEPVKIEEPVKMDDTPVPEPEIHVLDEKGSILFSLDSVETPAMDLPDSFYELTEQDVRKLYRDLRNQVTENDETPLKTAQIRQLEESKRILNQLSLYKKCVLRIQFPNRFILQSKYSSIEKIVVVKNHIRNFLKAPDIDFHLYVTPPKTILDENENLLEANCVPNALLHFGVNGETADNDFLKPELYEKLTTAHGASYAIAKGKQAVETGMEVDDGAGPSNASKPKIPSNFMESSAAPKTGKLPKWFKTGK